MLGSNLIFIVVGIFVIVLVVIALSWAFADKNKNLQKNNDLNFDDYKDINHRYIHDPTFSYRAENTFHHTL